MAKKATPNIKTYEALRLNDLLSSLGNLGKVSSDTRRTLIKAIRETQRIADEFRADFGELMKLMKVEIKDGTYVWQEREDRAEIDKSIQDLNATEHPWAHTISQKDLEIITADMRLIDIAFFEDVFVK